ncbi:hypothetical protein J6590_014224 [Homalodisca vitripennis]|nr:hypothetical protein J6590_014224 [Homalodisca vitripennis]
MFFSQHSLQVLKSSSRLSEVEEFEPLALFTMVLWNKQEMNKRVEKFLRPTIDITRYARVAGSREINKKLRVTTRSSVCSGTVFSE